MEAPSLENKIRSMGQIVTDTPAHAEGLYWYGVKVGRILGIFKRQ